LAPTLTLGRFWILLLAIVSSFGLGIVCSAYIPTWVTLFRDSDAKELASILLPPAVWVGAVVALFGILMQATRARYTLAIDLILKFGQRFETPEMRTTRAKAGNALLLDPTEGNECVDDVLNFFEELAFLVDRKAVDEEAAWEFFYYWVVRYYRATSQYRQAIEDEHPAEADVYSHFQSLNVRLERIERERLTKHTWAPLSDVQIKEFLEDEVSLVERRPRFRIGRVAR
jgi:hypothetical protein